MQSQVVLSRKLDVSLDLTQPGGGTLIQEGHRFGLAGLKRKELEGEEQVARQGMLIACWGLERDELDAEFGGLKRVIVLEIHVY